MPTRRQTGARRGNNSRRKDTTPRGIGQLDIISAEPDGHPQQQDDQDFLPTAPTERRPTRAGTPRPSGEEFDNAVSDDELLRLADDTYPQFINGGGVSSPARSKASERLWREVNFSDDEDELPATSSPKNDNLPDTLPLPELEQIDADIAVEMGKHSPVDLSETATTAHRSPSLRASEAQDYAWNYVSSRATSKRPMQDQDQSSGVGDEPPAAPVPNALVARVKKAPDTDAPYSKLEQGRENQIASCSGKSQARVQVELGAHEDSRAPEKLDTERSQASSTINPNQQAHTPLVNERSGARDPPKNISRLSANNVVNHKPSRFPDKQSSQGPSPDSVNKSGKKRKQRAKEPLIFDPETQAVKEEPLRKKRSPAAPKPPVKAVAKSIPASNSPATSKKRPAPQGPRKPAKKPKAGADPKQPPSVISPKRVGNRAAAQAAQAAVKKQLGSSPRSEVDAAGTLGAEIGAAQPIVERAPEFPSHRKAVAKPLSRKAFGGASGRMYTTNPKEQTVKDSQNDTQDHIRAHQTEEQSAKDHVSISSDQSSGLDEVQPPDSPPNPVPRIDEHDRKKTYNHARVEAGDAALTRENAATHSETAQSRLSGAATSNKVVQPRTYHATENRHAATSKAGHISSQGLLSRYRAPEQVEKDGSMKSSRHLQTNIRPDDGFVDNHPRQDRGRGRTISSGRNRMLTVSQEGSPSRLRNEETEITSAGRKAPPHEAPSSNSATVEHCLGHGTQVHTESVSRRLSYVQAASAQAKQVESAKDRPEFDVTEKALANPRGSTNASTKPSMLHNGRMGADALKIKNKIHNQILAASQAEEAPDREPVDVAEETSPMTARRVGIAAQLHSVVDLVTQRLNKSEKEIDQTIAAYETGTSRCVQRIRRRLSKEHAVLLGEWDGHGRMFTRSVEEAKKTMHDLAEARQRDSRGIEKTVSRRQLLYNEASKSLRAFQSQVMRD